MLCDNCNEVITALALQLVGFAAKLTCHVCFWGCALLLDESPLVMKARKK